MGEKIKNNVNFALLLLGLESALLTSIPFLIPHTGALALISFIPLFQMDALLRKTGRKHGFLYYYLSFLLFNIFTTWWVWNVSAGGCIAAIILNALQMAAVFAIFRWSRKYLGKTLSLLMFAITWVAWEHCYLETEVAWPWLCLGNSFARSTELAQWYDIFGTMGGSAWILICNILLFLTFSCKKRRRRLAVAACIAIFLPIICSEARYHTYHESSDPFDVVIVQPNIDPLEKFGVTRQEEIDSKLFELASPLVNSSTEYIITPETFTYGIDIDIPLENNSISFYADELSKMPGTNLLAGAITYKVYRSTIQPTKSARFMRSGYWYDAFNTVLSMDSTGVADHYFKSKLVPGAECIPYSRFLSFLAPVFQMMKGAASDYGRSEKMTALKSSSPHKTGVMICYESVFGDYSRSAVSDGASFMTVITNDGWWGDTPGYHQHFSFARLRAIEYRRDIVHVANTGTSGLIDQRGDVLLATPWWVETAASTTVNGNDAITPFVRYGDVVGRVCCYAFLCLLALTAFLLLSGKRFERD